MTNRDKLIMGYDLANGDDLSCVSFIRGEKIECILQGDKANFIYEYLKDKDTILKQQLELLKDATHIILDFHESNLNDEFYYESELYLRVEEILIKLKPIIGD